MGFAFIARQIASFYLLFLLFLVARLFLSLVIPTSCQAILSLYALAFSCMLCCFEVNAEVCLKRDSEQAEVLSRSTVSLRGINISNGIVIFYSARLLL